MNEFYLGALDLSPYIVSVHHGNYHTYIVEVDIPRTERGLALRFELIDLRASLYPYPVFIRYMGKHWSFVVKIDYADSHSIMFTIRNPLGWNISGLLGACPMSRFEGRVKLKLSESRIMA